jgi:hypothetical protein
MSSRVLVRVLAALLAWAAGATSAGAAGYWNVPSSFCQCMGYGLGAGYHAPLVLGPVSYDGWLATNLHRLPYAPAPPGAGCMYGSYHEFAQATRLEPARVAPAPRQIPLAPQPTSRVPRPLLLR